MAAEPFFHFGARKNSERFADLPPAGFVFEMAHQFSRHEQDSLFGLFRMTEFLNEILVSGVDRDRQVSWNSPGGRGPDDD